MRPVTVEYVVSQHFASMATQGVVGNINASQDTAEYWVGRYGNYQPFGHAGMDFACPVGTPVHAIADGTVVWADWGSNLPGSGAVRKWLFYATFPGILTVIQHDGWLSAYAHLSDNGLAPLGSQVKRGQVIALSGNTGGVDPHLHVEALVDLGYTTGGGLIYGRTDPQRFITDTPTEQEEYMAAPEWYGAVIQAIARTEKSVNEIKDRVLGRDVQRWFHPQTLEVRTEPFAGAIPARTTDVHDIISTNTLVASQSNKILDAIKDIPGVDSTVIAGLRQELSAELQSAVDGLSITLVKADK